MRPCLGVAAVTASDEVPAQWGAIHKAAPQLAQTMVAYVAQIGVSMRPSTARAVDTDLRIFAGFLLDHDPALGAVADIERSHIEAFKLWQWAQPGISGWLKPATFRRRLGQLRTFFLRIIEWGWDDAPARVPIFFGDVPKRDEALPRFLDDARFAKFMRVLADEPVVRRRVAVEVLARTGMRVGELCGLEADAVTLIGDAYWLRVPVGKLHNDRYVPLHPHLVELLELYRRTYGAHDHGRLLSGEQGVLNRYAVQRWITAIARRAGIGHVHPHQLRHTLATHAVNRGMSIEAIAALLGHRSLDMTLRYARISNRVWPTSTTPCRPGRGPLSRRRPATRRRGPEHAPAARAGPPPSPRQRLVPATRHPRLPLRIHLRVVHALRHRRQLHARPTPPARPRRCPPAGGPRSDVRPAPGRRRAELVIRS